MVGSRRTAHHCVIKFIAESGMDDKWLACDYAAGLQLVHRVKINQDRAVAFAGDFRRPEIRPAPQIFGHLAVMIKKNAVHLTPLVAP